MACFLFWYTVPRVGVNNWYRTETLLSFWSVLGQPGATNLYRLRYCQACEHRAVKAYCKAACFDLGATYPPNYDAFDYRHGRWVRRRAWVLPVSDELAALREWPGLRAILAIETIRHVQHQPGTHAQIRYYLTSCPDAPFGA